MTLNEEILINKFGQGLINMNEILDSFNIFQFKQKQKYLASLVDLIIQSKAVEADIKQAIIISGLKSTYTPCVLLEKGPYKHVYEKIINLPEFELQKALTLLLSLFKIAYIRRYHIEKNNPDKWWYWDLSDENLIKRIISY